MTLMTTSVICALMGALLLGAQTASAQTTTTAPITLTVTTDTRSYAIPPDFSGLSFGTISMKQGNNGYLFNSSSSQVLTLFQQLGIRNLRIGGSTVDENSSDYIPSPPDIDALFSFAQAAPVNVIYSLRLLNGEPGMDATEAQYVWQNYAPWVANFAIGNEPNNYPNADFSSYIQDWNTFASTILASVPTAAFGGPDSAGGTNGNDWGTEFAKGELDSGFVNATYFHYYACGSDRGLSKEDTITKMLSSKLIEDDYPKEYKQTGEVVLGLELPYRFTEADAFFTSGTDGVEGGDDSFASALFALDYMHYWAKKEISGVNFHTTMRKRNGVVHYDKASKVYSVYPSGYGIKAFDLGSHGYIQPVTMSNPTGSNVTAYAVGNGLDTYVTIINKTHGEASDTVSALATIQPVGILSSSASSILLTPGKPDYASSLNATLGGVSIPNDAQWAGRWSSLGAATAGIFTVTVEPATAVVVRVRAASNYAGPVQLNENGTLSIFGINTNNGQDVWMDQQNAARIPNNAANNWNGWTDLPGGVSSSGTPAVAKRLDNTLEVFVPGTDGHIFYNQQVTPDGTWNGWKDMGIASPGIAALQVGNNSDGSLTLFGVGPNGDVWYSSQSAPGTGWSSWTDLSGEQIQPGFVVGQNSYDTLELFGVDPHDNVWFNAQVAGGAWGGWSAVLGVNLNPRLAIARDVNGNLELFGVDSKYNVWTITHAPDGNWVGWNEITGKKIAPGFVVGQDVRGRLVVLGAEATFTPGNGFYVWTTRQIVPGGKFIEEWTPLGGDLSNTGLVVGNTADGSIQVFGIGQNHDVWSDWETGENGDWAGWSDFGGNGIVFYLQQTTQMPNFTLSASPSSLVLSQGGSSVETTITITPQNGFNGSLTLSAAGLPSGVTASFASNPTTATDLLTLVESTTTQPGTYQVTITGNSGSLANSATITLTVNP